MSCPLRKFGFSPGFVVSLSAGRCPLGGRDMLIIRDYEDGDRLPLSILYQSIRRQEFSWVKKGEATLDEFARDTKGEAILVADDDGYPAGFLSIWTPSKFIHCLYVDRDCRRRGIGSALIEEAGERYGYPLHLKCMDVNEKAKAFYRDSGWKITQKEQLSYGLCLLMQLDEKTRKRV